MLRRACTVCTAVIVLLGLWTAPSAAKGWSTGVECGTKPRPGCSVDASKSREQSRSDTDKPDVCRDPQGAVIPCERDGGWAGVDGCYYKQTDPSSSTVDALGGKPSGKGTWYDRTCYGTVNGAEAGLSQPTWLKTRPPEVVAQRAVSRLVLPGVSVRLSPSGEQLVGLPLWLWLSSGSWSRRSATARVPGVAVTARARPVEAVWSMGDGRSVVCQGPGTPWRAGMDPAASSPDCGYRYTSSSAGQPGAAFRVTVRVVWSVSWSGAGRSGTVTGLVTQGSVRVWVAESEALIAG
jgi:hypothetical protein